MQSLPVQIKEPYISNQSSVIYMYLLISSKFIRCCGCVVKWSNGWSSGLWCGRLHLSSDTAYTLASFFWQALCIRLMKKNKR